MGRFLRMGRSTSAARMKRRGLLLAVMLWCAAAAGGCGSSLPGTDLPPQRQVMPARGFPGLRDYRGVIDCRPRKSGISQEDLADLALAAQVDFICLTNPASGATSADYGVSGFTNSILFIAGAAFTPAGSAGEILGIGLRDAIDPGQNADALIRAIHRQGAIAVVNEPARFSSPADYALADAIEVYNQREAWAALSPRRLYLRGLFLSPDRFFAALDTIPPQNLYAYDDMAKGARVALLAGIGAEPRFSVMGSIVGTFTQLFEVYTTHLLAAERREDPLMEALKRGHAYVSFDLLGYVGDFAFYAQGGGAKVMMGDATGFSPGVRLKVELPGVADEVVIVGDGQRVASARRVAAFDYAPSKPGAYRVEAYRSGHPWILSNPVYLR